MLALDDRQKVLLAGVLSLVVTVGVARFAYTSLLPSMQAATALDAQGAGWLATLNYVGYMIGALLAASIGDLKLKDRLYRAFLVIAVLTTWATGVTENFWLWAVLRLLSGISSAGGLLIASGLILNWLIRHKHPGELGLHFAGVGVGIITVSLCVEVMLRQQLNWAMQWQYLAAFAAVLSFWAWRWMPQPDTRPITQTGEALVDRPPTPLFMWTLFLAYFCAGYGYVISATFIVDLVERQESLRGLGQWAFLVVGVGALPAVFIWDAVARRVGYLKALLLAYLIQVFGIALPVFYDGLWGIVASALLYGGTFIGCVSLVLTLAGHFYPTKPAKLMGKMTLSYGAAQIVAPALTGWLLATQGNYQLGLILAAGVLCVGAVLIAALVRQAEQSPH